MNHDNMFYFGQFRNRDLIFIIFVVNIPVKYFTLQVVLINDRLHGIT